MEDWQLARIAGLSINGSSEVRADKLRKFAALVRADERAEYMRALQQADNIMGHDDEQTMWRERWQHLWPWSRSSPQLTEQQS